MHIAYTIIYCLDFIDRNVSRTHIYKKKNLNTKSFVSCLVKYLFYTFTSIKKAEMKKSSILIENHNLQHYNRLIHVMCISRIDSLLIYRMPSGNVLARQIVSPKCDSYPLRGILCRPLCTQTL